MARLQIFHPQTRSRSAGRFVVVAAAVAATAAQHGRVNVIIVTAPISTQLNEVTVQSVQWCGRAAAATHAADAGTTVLVLHTNTNKGGNRAAAAAPADAAGIAEIVSKVENDGAVVIAH